MRVEIRSGGDGVECWNRRAIERYADEVNQREAYLAERNPDLLVVSGRISCYGCEVQEYGFGTKCTAQIAKTVYAVPGEVQPRSTDAAGWHREIPGLATIRPEDLPESPTAAPRTVDPEPAPPAGRSVRRGFFGRS